MIQLNSGTLVKPENCKCLYPEVIARNGNGHDEKCPAYAEWLKSIQVTPKRNEVKVKSDGGNHLFLYFVKEQMVEIHRRGFVYRIPLHDLIDFGSNSERPVFRVIPVERGEDEDAGDVVRQGSE